MRVYRCNGQWFRTQGELKAAHAHARPASCAVNVPSDHGGLVGFLKTIGSSETSRPTSSPSGGSGVGAFGTTEDAELAELRDWTLARCKYRIVGEATVRQRAEAVVRWRADGDAAFGRVDSAATDRDGPHRLHARTRD